MSYLQLEVRAHVWNHHQLNLSFPFLQLYHMLSGLYPYWDTLDEAISSDRTEIVDHVCHSEVSTPRNLLCGGIDWDKTLTAFVRSLVAGSLPCATAAARVGTRYVEYKP